MTHYMDDPAARARALERRQATRAQLGPRLGRPPVVPRPIIAQPSPIVQRWSRRAHLKSPPTRDSP